MTTDEMIKAIAMDYVIDIHIVEQVAAHLSGEITYDRLEEAVANEIEDTIDSSEDFLEQDFL